MNKVTYHRKSYSINAVQLAKENLQEIVDLVPDAVLHPGGVAADYEEPCISHLGHYFGVGDWYAWMPAIHLFFSAENFAKKFQTHPELMAENEEYARVFQLVMRAMNEQDSATKYGETDGMDLTAMRITREILKQL